MKSLVICSFGERLVLSIAFPIFVRKEAPSREERDREMRQDRLHQNINYSLNLSQNRKSKSWRSGKISSTSGFARPDGGSAN